MARLIGISQIRTACPATRNLCEWLDTQFNITAIDRLYYQGNIAGSEFLTYAATKLYLALGLSHSIGTSGVGNPGFTIYNELNVIVYYSGIASVYYDTSIPGVRSSTLSAPHDVPLYFSRVVAVGIAQMKFNGYRLTIA